MLSGIANCGLPTTRYRASGVAVPARDPATSPSEVQSTSPQLPKSSMPVFGPQTLT